MNALTKRELHARVEAHRKAVRRNPRDASAHALLGLSLLRIEERESGTAALQRALELNPKLPGIHEVLADALLDLRKFADAEKYYRKALLSQDTAGVHRGLAECLSRLERADEAEPYALRALELAPDNITCMLSYAGVLHAQKRNIEAREVLLNVRDRAPTAPAERFDLGRLLFHIGEHQSALDVLNELLITEPNDVLALQYVALCQKKLEQRDDAIKSLQEALVLAPGNSLLLLELANELRDAGRIEEAEKTAHELLEHDPKNQEALNFLVHLYFSRGRFEEAVAAARHLLAVAPCAAHNSIVLFILSHWTEDPELLTREHFAFGERWEQPLISLRQPHTNTPDPNKVLHVGIVSGDLHHHAVASFLTPALEGLKSIPELKIYIYYNKKTWDGVTRRIHALVSSWRDIAGVPDEEVEQFIREDEIDILIDLSGHSALNRLALFARKPAPVQATWIGYAGTTGLQAMDYILCDQFLVPGTRYHDQFSEKIVKLPIGTPFISNPQAPPIAPLPALKNGYITFGSFHRLSKLNEKVIQQWALLLHAIPTSRMFLGGIEPGGDDILAGWFANAGIPRDRLDFRPRCGMHAYLSLHAEVDIALCPFPYTGGTTVGHALWMGVPTLTTIGPTNPSHAAASFMTHLGLNTFITESPETYVKLAVFLSENLPALATLRATMRERFTKSALGYPHIMAASLALALRRMWQRWCRGEAPEHMEVALRDLIAAESTDPQATQSA